MLSFSPITVDDYASFCNCMPVGRLKVTCIRLSWLGPEVLVSYLAYQGSRGVFLLIQIFNGCLAFQLEMSGSILYLCVRVTL